jgi:AcrR family transcriptional regulator
MSDQATKAHILEATITAIESHGLPGLTTRLIAGQAKVNNAALHYYFGTKEALLEAALGLTLEHMMADTEEILSRPIPIQERLRSLLGYLIEGTYAFPNVIRAHLWAPLMEGNADSPFELMQDAWTERIWREIRRERPGSSESALRLALQTTLGGIVFLALLPPSNAPAGRISLHGKKARDRYIDQLVEFVLASAGGGGGVSRKPRRKPGA